jgi:hypothetical protein
MAKPKISSLIARSHFPDLLLLPDYTMCVRLPSLTTKYGRVRYSPSDASLDVTN